MSEETNIPDSVRFAKDFCEIYKNVDISTARFWFANAILEGYVSGYTDCKKQMKALFGGVKKS